MQDNNIIESGVHEDQYGQWGLYIVPKDAQETCITVDEMLEALAEIEALRD